MGVALVTKRVVCYFQSKVMLYLPFITWQKPFNQLYITNKMECFSFNSGHVMRVVKLIKEDWPIVLQ